MSHGPKKQRPRETFRQTYRSGTFINKEKLPRTLPYLTPDCKIEAIELKAAGTLLWNGRKLEFQDVRVYVTPAPEAIRTPLLTDKYEPNDNNALYRKCGKEWHEHEPNTLRCIA